MCFHLQSVAQIVPGREAVVLLASSCFGTEPKNIVKKKKKHKVDPSEEKQGCEIMTSKQMIVWKGCDEAKYAAPLILARGLQDINRLITPVNHKAYVQSQT